RVLHDHIAATEQSRVSVDTQVGVQTRWRLNVFTLVLPQVGRRQFHLGDKPQTRRASRDSFGTHDGQVVSHDSSISALPSLITRHTTTTRATQTSAPKGVTGRVHWQTLTRPTSRML